MFNGVIQAKLLGNSDGSADIVRPMSVNPAAHFSPNHRNQRFQTEVIFARLDSVVAHIFQPLGIIPSLSQRFPQQSGVAHAGHGRFVLGTIVSFGVFAQGHFHRLRAGNPHLVGHLAPQLEGHACAANQVARAWAGVTGGEAGAANLLNGEIKGIQRVDPPQMSLDGPAHLVAVVAGAVPVGLVKGGDMGMGVDQARGHPFACGVHNFRVGGNLHIGAYRFDLAPLYQNSPLVHKGSVGLQYLAVFNRNHRAIPPIYNLPLC